ncbi:MAG TPA: hypothetical protein VL095_11080 [Flavisolibacter sp.]|nr:hypothetical protein [Flavisolibacter sp.]
MTRLEKIFMAVLLVLIIGTIVFWDDVSSVFTKRESVVDNQPKKDKKNKKEKKDKDDDKKKDNKGEAGKTFFLNSPAIA